MRNKPSKMSNVRLNGANLVSDFQSALTNKLTEQMASIAARQSEQDTLQNIMSSGVARDLSTPLTPEMSVGTQDLLVRSSLDAHVKKVQATQVRSMVASQMIKMQSESESTFVNKKVAIKVLDQVFEPVESYWFNSKTGHEHIGLVKRALIKGTITKINLDQNLLIIEPTLSSRLINPSRKYYLVYVINTETLTPAVTIDLL